MRGRVFCCRRVMKIALQVTSLEGVLVGIYKKKNFENLYHKFRVLRAHRFSNKTGHPAEVESRPCNDIDSCQVDSCKVVRKVFPSRTRLRLLGKEWVMLNITRQ